MVLSEWRRASATHRSPGSPGAIGLAGCPAPASIGDVWQGGWISLRQSCDNAGVVAASHKGISLKQPLASVLQSLALYAARHKLQLRISHVAGSRNEWADVLSRRRALDADFSRMRSKGSRFTLGVWGLRVCSLDVAFVVATVRNRPQPFARSPYGRAYGKFCRGGPFWRFQTSGCFVSRGRRGTS